MKIVLSGLFYPMAILRYFEAALKRRDDVELYCIGPYSGSWIPWNGGMSLPKKYAIEPDMPLPLGNNSARLMPVDYVENVLPWKPDLWLQVDAGFYLIGKPKSGKNVIVATDPHVLNYDRQRLFADIFYCMQTPYMQNGDKYLPYAYDPIWHAPEKREQQYDACLIGLHYENRNLLVDRLRENGLKVWYDLGPSFDEARMFYNQAPIGLNWSSRLDLVARVFELLGMGRLAVVNRVPDLEKFFNDGHLAIFETLDEAVEKTLYYHNNKDEAVEVAEAGHKQVQEHTWDARIERIFNDI